MAVASMIWSIIGFISVWTLLHQYERAKHLCGDLVAFGDGTLNIPENHNGVPDILDEARSQVLNGGAGLDTGQVLRVLDLPDDRLDEALSLAHEVRMRWCGPEVEVGTFLFAERHDPGGDPCSSGCVEQQ